MSTNILTPLDHILIQHIQSGDFERAVVTLRQVTTQSVLDKLAEGISPETAKNLAIF